MSWPVFLSVCAGGLLFAFLIGLGAHFDERRWKREREAEQAARRPAE